MKYTIAQVKDWLINGDANDEGMGDSSESLSAMVRAIEEIEVLGVENATLKQQLKITTNALNALLCLPEVHDDWSVAIMAREVFAKIKEIGGSK